VFKYHLVDTASRFSIALCCCIAFAQTHTTPAHAQEIDETLRWVPTLSVSFDMLGQKASAEIENGQVFGPPLPEGCPAGAGPGRPGSPGRLCPSTDFDQQRDTQIRPDERGSDTMVAPLVASSLELVTPRLLDALWRPRLFARGDVALSYRFESNLAGEGKPGAYMRPRFLENDRRIPEIGVAGQGSRAVAQLDRYTFSGGAGIVFTRKFLGRDLRIRTSFESLREVLEIKGAVNRAVALNQDDLDLSRFRFITLRDEAKEVIWIWRHRIIR
jgi:hypothetical protein